MKNRYIAFAVCLALAGTIACKKKKDEEVTAVVTPVTPVEVNLKADFLTTYANIAHSTAAEALGTASLLKAAIDLFVATPNAANLTACKTAYETSRKAYLQTEAFRGVSGPVEEVEGFMNSWPLDEAYIDFVFNANDNKDTVKVDGKLNGIVNDLTKTIDKPTLATLNGEEGEDKITVGFHAIEFLLWGQDVSATTAGTRPDTDYLTNNKATAPNGARRGAYLKVCADLLIDNLTTIVNAWKPGVTGNYRADFLDAKNRDSRLSTIMSGMTNLTTGEFAGERISPALENKNQEEEHSCFSDLTKVDFKYDVVGYENIILGKHTLQPVNGISAVSVNGTGLKALLESVSAEKANGLLAAINTLKASTEAVFVSTSRYDQTILKADTDPEVVKVQTMANDWNGLSTALNAATVALGYVVAVPEE